VPLRPLKLLPKAKCKVQRDALKIKMDMQIDTMPSLSFQKINYVFKYQMILKLLRNQPSKEMPPSLSILNSSGG